MLSFLKIFHALSPSHTFFSPIIAISSNNLPFTLAFSLAFTKYCFLFSQSYMPIRLFSFLQILLSIFTSEYFLITTVSHNLAFCLFTPLTFLFCFLYCFLLLMCSVYSYFCLLSVCFILSTVLPSFCLFLRQSLTLYSFFLLLLLFLTCFISSCLALIMYFLSLFLFLLPSFYLSHLQLPI